MVTLTCEACGHRPSEPHELGDYLYDGWCVAGEVDAFGQDFGSTLCDECAPREVWA